MSSRTLSYQSLKRGGKLQLLNVVTTSLDDPLRAGRIGFSIRVVGGRVSSRTLLESEFEVRENDLNHWIGWMNF